MKKSELVKIIKTAVREEIKSCLPKLLSELVVNNPIKKNIDPVEITNEVLSVGRAKQKKPQKTYSNNKILNQVLNETVGGIPQEGSKVGDTNKFTDLNGQPVEVERLPDHVSNALTRDYSQLMGAVEKKKKQKMGIN